MRKPLLLFGLACMLDVAGCARNGERVFPAFDVVGGAEAVDSGTTNTDVGVDGDDSFDGDVRRDADATIDAGSDAVDRCTAGCAESCQVPFLCAADGSQWCNECELQCAGAGPAVDTAFCNGCAPPPDWTPIESRNIEIPEDCTSEVAFAVTVDEGEFLDQLFQCEAGRLSERIDVDFTREQLYLWIGFDNPNTRIAGVYDDGSNLWAYAVEEAYCLGIPPAPLNHRLVAFEPIQPRISVLAQSCQYGTCGDPPRP